MAVAIPRSSRIPSVARVAARGWTALVALALKLNGSAMPLELYAADRAELERTIFG